MVIIRKTPVCLYGRRPIAYRWRWYWAQAGFALMGVSEVPFGARGSNRVTVLNCILANANSAASQSGSVTLARIGLSSGDASLLIVSAGLYDAAVQSHRKSMKEPGNGIRNFAPMFKLENKPCLPRNWTKNRPSPPSIHYECLARKPGRSTAAGLTRFLIRWALFGTRKRTLAEAVLTWVVAYDGKLPSGKQDGRF